MFVLADNTRGIYQGEYLTKLMPTDGKIHLPSVGETFRSDFRGKDDLQRGPYAEGYWETMENLIGSLWIDHMGIVWVIDHNEQGDLLLGRETDWEEYWV